MRTRSGIFFGRKSFLREIPLAIRFFFDLARGLYTFRHIERCVTVYGSARIEANNPYYATAQALGKALAEKEYSVMTGAGPGIMEAVNRGAKTSQKGKSFGCAIDLPHEPIAKRFLDQWIMFRYFFSRKLILTKYSSAFIALPGGFGTFDELFEVATLVQTGRIKKLPIILIGKTFWSPLMHYFQQQLLPLGTIGPADIETIFFLTDSPEAAVAYVENFLQETK